MNSLLGNPATQLILRLSLLGNPATQLILRLSLLGNPVTQQHYWAIQQLN
jgi:hypothetical protein